MKEQKKGISLIVLIITIIVMIILASAVIITLSNSNIITKAKEAVNTTNEKALKQQADLFAADLILDFRTKGLGNIYVSEYVKEKYINAIKQGKTSGEAEELAKDVFIGKYEDYTQVDATNIYVNLLNNPHLTREYNEVRRVVLLIENGNEGQLNINKDILPSDLVTSLELYQNMTVEYMKGNKTDEEFDDFYYNNEPLYSLLTEDSNGKYYSYIEDSGTLVWPYYIYTFVSKIVKLSDYTKDYSGFKNWNEIKKLVVDDNYTILSAHDLPPVEGDCEIVLPNTLKKIEDNAFFQVKVNTITIPRSVESISEAAFTKSKNNIKTLIIQKEEGSIPGKPWGLDTTKTTIKWEP